MRNEVKNGGKAMPEEAVQKELFALAIPCQTAVETAEKFIRNWPGCIWHNAGLMFWGGPGTGKSVLADWIASEIESKGLFVDMLSMPRLMATLEGGEADEIRRETAGLIQSDLVVLDDYDPGYCTGRGVLLLESALGDRAYRKLPTIVTTRIPPEQLAVLAGHRNRWGRLHDQILSHCCPVECRKTEESRRREAADERWARQYLGVQPLIREGRP